MPDFWMVGYRQVECLNGCAGNLFQEYGSKSGRFTVRRTRGVLLSQIENKFADKRRNGDRTACFRHHCSAGLNKQKTGTCILRYAATVRRIAWDPDSMPWRDKPQGILNFAAHSAVQRQDKLTFPVSVRSDASIFLRRCHVQSNRCLRESIGVKFVG